MNSFYGPEDIWRAGAILIDKPFPSKKYAPWCKENCKGKYDVGIWFIEFELEQDAVLFKLRWS